MLLVVCCLLQFVVCRLFGIVVRCSLLFVVDVVCCLAFDRSFLVCGCLLVGVVDCCVSFVVVWSLLFAVVCCL